MGLARMVASDPVHNVIIAISKLTADDGTPVDPVAESLPVSVAFPLVGASPDDGPFLDASWVAAAGGGFLARCQVGSGTPNGPLGPGQYQPYVRVVSGGATDTVPAADVLEVY
ncbi:MAG: hypothetical protein J2P30_00505 [Actinobacteria bacterium]|nr:hypothetical protein [Actinomycetota bacterium]